MLDRFTAVTASAAARCARTARDLICSMSSAITRSVPANRAAAANTAKPVGPQRKTRLPSNQESSCGSVSKAATTAASEGTNMMVP